MRRESRETESPSQSNPMRQINRFPPRPVQSGVRLGLSWDLRCRDFLCLYGVLYSHLPVCCAVTAFTWLLCVGIRSTSQAASKPAEATWYRLMNEKRRLAG